MSEIIEELRGLQQIELQLAEFRRSRESKERRLETRRRNLGKLNEKIEAARRVCMERQVRFDELQLDVAAREDSISHHRQALNKAKTNKEYAAVLTAMNTEKADNAKIETAMLEAAKEMEASQAEIATQQAEQEKLRGELAKSEAELAAADAAVADELKRLRGERESYASRIPPAAMEAFNRASARHDGEALARVVKPRPKEDEYSCSGCNLKVRLEVVNALKSRDEVQVCGSCSRILYVEPSAARR